MVDHEVFDRRLGKLEEILRELRELAAGASPQEYLQDRRLQAQAERWLHLAAECCLDLANHLIADRGWRSPSTYRETFTILREQGVVSGELSKRLEDWAGLRNVLVHLYLDLDHSRLWQFLTEELDDLEAFARAVAAAASE